MRDGRGRLSRVAAIDCGTNSIRLLIADVDGPALADVDRELRIVRLGEGVDSTGQLSAAAIARTRAVLIDYAERIARHGAETVRMVATSATRDAANRDDFTAVVQAVLGVAPEVISGDEEAALSFQGAVHGLPGVSGRILVADIGGGSTELVAGATDGSEPLRARSVDVGCVRMTERHLRDDPPTAEQIADTVHDVSTALRRAARDVALTAPATLIGVAGTVTTVAALAAGLDRYEPRRIHGLIVSRDAVRAVTASLLGMTRAERAALPVMHEGRVDVIGGGALILRTLMEITGSDAVVASEHDILDGMVLRLAATA